MHVLATVKRVEIVMAACDTARTCVSLFGQSMKFAVTPGGGASAPCSLEIKADTILMSLASGKQGQLGERTGGIMSFRTILAC